MAKLTEAERNALPKSSFAIPSKRAYPIHDKNHARDALSRVAANGTEAEKAMVRAAVARRYPEIDQSAHEPKKAAPKHSPADKAKAAVHAHGKHKKKRQLHPAMVQHQFKPKSGASAPAKEAPRLDNRPNAFRPSAGLMSGMPKKK